MVSQDFHMTAPELDKAEPLTEHEVALVKAVAEPLNAEISRLKAEMAERTSLRGFGTRPCDGMPCERLQAAEKQLAERTAERDAANEQTDEWCKAFVTERERAEAAEARVKQLLEALRLFAQQKKYTEMTEDEQEGGAFEDAYDIMIDHSREALRAAANGGAEG